MVLSACRFHRSLCVTATLQQLTRPCRPGSCSLRTHSMRKSVSCYCANYHIRSRNSCKSLVLNFPQGDNTSNFWNFPRQFNDLAKSMQSSFLPHRQFLNRHGLFQSTLKSLTQFDMAKTICCMVIYHTGCLHKGVTNSAADKFKTLLFQFPGHRIRGRCAYRDMP